ncbi:MAG: hypothetical protein ACSHWZ_00990 [Sulfitobacter sp.]
MDYIADILLGAGALAAAFYCMVLGRRLNRFNDLEKGVGGAVAVLSAQVDDLTKTLAAAQAAANSSAQILTELTGRAEEMSRRLELQMAALHDIPSQPVTAQPTSEAAEPAPQPAPKPAATAPTPPAQNEPMFVRHRVTGAV